MNSAKSVLKINLSAIASNYKLLQAESKNSKVAVSVKANAYGLGAPVIAKALYSEGCRDFFAASTSEGAEIRQVLGDKANIYVIYGPFGDDCRILQKHNLIPVINHLEQLKLWQSFSKNIQKNLPFVLHIDSGINRFGMPMIEAEKLVNDNKLFSNLEMSYLMSHLSSSEEKDNIMNVRQLDRFNKFAARFPNVKKSFANSSGIFLGDHYHFDLVRPGAAVYGLNPVPGDVNPMRNVVTLTAPIIQVKTIEKGERVGYNGTFLAHKKRTIATLPIGYADGYPRSLSNKGVVYINNRRAFVIGRVSMDLITIDVSDLPSEDIFLGQEVEVIGENATPDKIANLAGTNGYEILTNLGNRFERVYTEN